MPPSSLLFIPNIFKQRFFLRTTMLLYRFICKVYKQPPLEPFDALFLNLNSLRAFPELSVTSGIRKDGSSLPLIPNLKENPKEGYHASPYVQHQQ